MSKRKVTKRDKVNWSNPKTMSVAGYLQLGENRITKAEILELANKDIFYQLKNSGYIKETTKGSFIGTSKLHNYIKEHEGGLFSSSSSAEHSHAIRKSLSFVPKSAMEQRHFQSASDIEKRFNRTVKNSPLYKEELASLKNDYSRELVALEQEHKTFLASPHNSSAAWNERTFYDAKKESIYQKLHILEEKPYLVPDYQLTLNREELSAYISNLENHAKDLPDQSKASQHYCNSVNKLKELSCSMSSDVITFNVEIVTDTYGNREMQMHENFELFSDTPQIYLM